MILGINISFSKHPHVMMEAILRQPKCEELKKKGIFCHIIFIFLLPNFKKRIFFGEQKFTIFGL
jgi:hypothetical protein